MDPAKSFGHCDICSEPYNESYRAPKFLSCFHTLCLNCIQKEARNSAIICPFCRKETSFGPKGTSELQSNFYIMNRLPELANTDSAPKKEKPLKWCSSCNCLAIPECESSSHGVSNLGDSSIENVHLHSLLFLCKSKWMTICSSQQQVHKYIEIGLQSVNRLRQDLQAMVYNNAAKLKQSQQYLKDLDADIKDAEAGSDSSKDWTRIQSLLQKHSSFYREGQEEIQNVMDVANCFNSLQTGSAAVEFTNKNSTKTELRNFKLGLPAENNWLTILSFILFKEAFPVQVEHLMTAGAGTRKPDGNAQPKVEEKLEQRMMNTSLENTGAIRKEPKPAKKQNEKRTERKGPKPNKGDTNQTKNKTSKKAQQDTGSKNFGSLVNLHVPPPSFTLPTQQLKKNVIFSITRNGQPFGSFTVQLCSDVAPVMCTKFLQFCQGNDPHSYFGSSIYGAKPNVAIYGGRINGFSRAFAYPADQCTLQRTRGAISMRLMDDVKTSKSFIVGAEFAIHLESIPSKSSTVFGYVTEGLGLCEVISQLDVSTNSFLFNKIIIV